MEKGLLNDFEKHSAENWKEQLVKDLRGEPYESLLWKTRGIEGKPFYTAEDLDFEHFNYSNFSKDSALFGDRYWINYQPISVQNEKQANTTALHALSHGATGIIFRLNKPVDLSLLLSGIQPQFCHLSFELANWETNQFLDAYKTHLDGSNIPSEEIQGFIVGGKPQTELNLKSIVLQVESTENTSFDLAMTLAQMIDQVDELTEKGTSIEKCLQQVLFQRKVENDFFLEVAIHRALRRLFVTISAAYGIADSQANIISSIGSWDQEIDDIHSFMLHATTQAMSSIIGGTDGVIVEPFYEIFPNKPLLAERMARNISTILNEESYLSKIVDPAAGSYYIESLTEKLFEESMEILRQVEANGGLSKIDVESFKAGIQ